MDRDTPSPFAPKPGLPLPAGKLAYKVAAVLLLATLGALVVITVMRSGPHNGLAQAPKENDKEKNLNAPLPLFQGWREKPDLVFVLSAQAHGYLQPCGCSSPQYGGLARRHQFIQSLRDKGWPVLPLDLGDMSQNSGAQATLNTTIARATARPPELGAAAQAKAMVQAIRDDRTLSAALVEVAGKTPPETLKLQPDTCQLLAALADRARKFNEAERFFRLSLPDATPANEALLYGSLLRTLWKAHKYSAVIEVCRDGLKKAQATNHVLFYTDLARAQARLGQAKEALLDVDRALRLATDADRLAVRHLRVRILTNAEQYDAAERECRLLLEDYPQPADQLEIRYLLSNVFHAKKDMPKSEEQLKLILDQDPNNITANNDLGYLWADQNKHLEKAEAMIRKALDLEKRQRQLRRDSAAAEDHDNAAYVDSLGWVLYRTGKLEEACQELERAVRLPDGDDPTLWDHLGDVYRDLNRHDQARQAYQQSVRLFEEEARRDRDERLQETRRKLKKLENGRGE